MRRKRNQITPKSPASNKTHNNANYQRKSRPKSAPKHNGQQDDTGSPVPELDDYSSVADESSEEDIEISRRSHQDDGESGSETESESTSASKSEVALDDDKVDKSDKDVESKNPEIQKKKLTKKKIQKNKVS